MKKHLVLASVLVVCSNVVHSVVLEYPEDAYFASAQQELVDCTERIASLVHFDKPYNVMTPKKPAVHTNPWLRFVASGVNPQTGVAFVTVNPEWLMSMPSNEQDFLIARAFVTLQRGLLPSYFQWLGWVSFIILFLLAFMMTFFLRTRNSGNPLVNGLTVFVLIMLFSWFVMRPGQAWIQRSLAMRHEQQTIEAVLEKTMDRDAAIKALERFDTAIKHEFDNGETFWAPHVGLFQGYADSLKK